MVRRSAVPRPTDARASPADGAARLTRLLGDVRAQRPPLYAALADRVRLLVADGRLPVGTRLPAERDLAAATGVSRATVSAAYQRLHDDGWLTARRGAGSWTRLPASSGALGAWAPEPPDEGVVDLAHAAPPAPPHVHAAFTAALADLPALLPGHGYHPTGLADLRERIAASYCRRGLPTTAGQVVVTAGALHAASVAFDVLLRRGDRLLVEQPSYPSALHAARGAGARLVGVPVEGPGRDAADDVPDAGAAVAAAVRAAGPRAAYLMPDHQNPSGRHLDAAGRSRVAAVLRAGDVTAVVDETLAGLWLDGPDTPPPFAACADPARVVTVGTLSKTVWGGLRIGWLRAEGDLLARLTATLARTHLSGPVLEQLAAVHLLDDLEPVVSWHRDRLREQRDALVTALSDALPQWDFRLPTGGLSLWCRLPGQTSTALAAAAPSRGLRLAPGPRFGTGHAFDDRLRLPFTQPVEVLRPAVATLAALDAECGGAVGTGPVERLVV